METYSGNGHENRRHQSGTLTPFHPPPASAAQAAAAPQATPPVLSHRLKTKLYTSGVLTAGHSPLVHYEINLVFGISDLANEIKSAVHELMAQHWYIKPVTYAHTDTHALSCDIN